MNDTTDPTKLPSTGDIASAFNKMHQNRQTILTNCEQYAAWTIPTIFPDENHMSSTELQNDFQSIGAQAVTHMANVLTTALMPPQKPFFSITIGSETMNKLTERGISEAEINAAAVETEQACLQLSDQMRMRSALMRASELLVTTGNALIYRPQGEYASEAVQAYSLRNYVVRRDVFGNVIELITRDRKDLYSFDKATQDSIQATRPIEMREEQDVTLYTRILLGDDARYHVHQSADNYTLDTKGSYHKDSCPYFALTWRLVEGEDYGRGLVESYAGDFNALSVLYQALVEGAAIMADIKWLVNPMGSTDVDELNDTPSGSYVSGMPGDIAGVQLDKSSDFQWVMNLVQTYEKRIGQAFMLASSVQRDAERVTATEIRYMVGELNKSHGGVYASLTDTFQLPYANLLLDEVGFTIKGAEDVSPSITTGVDSLARETKGENLNLFFQDLGVIQAVPEEFRARLKPNDIMLDFGSARGIDASQYLKTDEEVEADQKRQMAIDTIMMANQEQAKVEANTP